LYPTILDEGRKMRNKILKTFIYLMISFTTLALLLNALQPSTGSVKSQETSQIASPDPALKITTETAKESYLLRQNVLVEGNITQDGTPATDLVVPMQVKDPLQTTVAYRTLTIGNPTQTWVVNITNLFLLDSESNPINTAKSGTTIQAGMTIYNWQITQREVYATITVFDANMAPLRASSYTGTIDPLQEFSPRFSIYIPKWACTGRALICGNVYSKEPNTGGTALSQEKTMYYCVSRTEQGLIEYPPLPPPPPQTTPGKYQTNITLSPDPLSGTYNIHVLGQASPIIISSATTTFNVENSAGYPPQASFAYWPAAPLLNQTVNFDASSSTPEGFNDSITSYKWNFGDNKPPITESDPYITHNYQQTGTFIVTLNVTDNEGLWSTTSKPITIYPEFGPTANFTWTPIEPIINENVTFDASNSTLGWCANTQRFSPIQTYTWNFSDDTGEIVVTTPAITHNFTQPGNYTVKLRIVDADGRSDQVSALVQVLNVTLKMYDVNGDGKIDLKDVYRVAKAYGSFPGHPRWDPACDFNKDNKVDLKDYYPVCKNYGKDP